MAGAVRATEEKLVDCPETRGRTEQVLDLAEGYETAYGLELLASVHWIASHVAAGESDEAIARELSQWSPSKARVFTAAHVDAALLTLREHGLLEAA